MSIWDLVQQVQIENLKNRQISGESEAERAASRTRALGDEVHDRMERLVLVTEALWELLSERAGLTAADLATCARNRRARRSRGRPAQRGDRRTADSLPIVSGGRTGREDEVPVLQGESSQRRKRIRFDSDRVRSGPNWRPQAAPKSNPRRGVAMTNGASAYAGAFAESLTAASLAGFHPFFSPQDLSIGPR